MAYDYIRQIELSDGTVKPVGATSVWQSTGESGGRLFRFTLEYAGTSNPQLFDMVELQINNLKNSVPTMTKIYLQVSGAAPNSVYFYETTEPSELVTIAFSGVLTTETSRFVSYQIMYPSDTAHSIKVITNNPKLTVYGGATSSESGGGSITPYTAQRLNILSSTHDYGDTLPDAGNPGRIFFKKV